MFVFLLQAQCQARLFDLVTNQFFEVFMVMVISLNMVVMMVEAWQQSRETEVILYWADFIFFLIFFIEFSLKIVALRHHYFTSCWNIVDFVVLVGLVVGESAGSQ